MMYKYRNGFLFLTIFLHSFVKSCTVYDNSAECSSLNDIIEEGMPIWEEIYATNSKNEAFQALKKKSFEHTPNVEKISIVKLINGMEMGVFENLPHLTEIYFDQNAIREIPRGVFENLLIEKLSLDRCGITKLARGCLSNNPELKIIKITSNSISIITNNVFNNLNIAELYLYKNNIRVIEDDAFENMPNLKILDLNFNKLTAFEPRYVLGKNHALQYLYLHSNNLTTINTKLFSGLFHLSRINLRSNQINNIEANSFQDISNLDYLDISNNQLDAILPEVFPSRGMNITKLYINNNQLSFLSTAMLARLYSLTYVSFAGNPWQCPCLNDIIVWITRNNVSFSCDREYFKGTRPVCVVGLSDPKDCVFDETKNRESVEYYLRELHEYPQAILC